MAVHEVLQAGTFVLLEVELGWSALVLAGTGSPTPLPAALGQRRAELGSLLCTPAQDSLAQVLYVMAAKAFINSIQDQ